METDFFKRGWCAFGPDLILTEWLDHAAPIIRATINDPAHAEWLRCGGTWFAGVNVLENDAQAALPGGKLLAGAAIDFITNTLNLSGFAWDKAQISVCYPGYPQPWDGESDAAFGYRKNRDAAHVDGLLKERPDNRRFLREHHGFILGIPVSDADPDASPLVIWEGSHEIVRTAFTERFGGIPPDQWADEDVTDAYHAVRRTIFETCRRVPIHVKPGEAFIVHRLALHGVAPWAEGAKADVDGRIIVYLRPGVGGPTDWLSAP